MKQTGEDYLLWDDEHRDQEQGDVYAAHHLGVFHQPYPSQDGCIVSAVEQSRAFMAGLHFHFHISNMIILCKHDIYKCTVVFWSWEPSAYGWYGHTVVLALTHFWHSVPPAAVPAARDVRIEDLSIGLEEILLGAEDDDVICCGGQGEEEHFELKAYAEEDSTCNEW